MSEKPWWSQENTEVEEPEVSKVRPKNNKLTIIGSVALVTLLTGGLIAATFTKSNPYAAHPSQYESTLHPATVRGVINECGGIFAYSPPARFYGTLPDEFFPGEEGNEEPRQTQKHPMIVPAYGYMAPADKVPEAIPHFFDTSSKTVPSREQVLRMMWDGWTILWYVPPIPDRSNLTADEIENTFNPETIEAIKQYAGKHEKMVALPWRETNPLPRDRNLAIATWGVTQTCKLWDPALVDEFLAKKDDLTPIRSVEPPMAKLNEDGDVYPINPDR